MATGTIAMPFGKEVLTPNYPTGTASQAGQMFRYGKLLIISKCLKITQNFSNGATILQIPSINAEWGYLLVVQGDTVTPAHIYGSNIILDADLNISAGQYPIIEGVTILA